MLDSVGVFRAGAIVIALAGTSPAVAQEPPPAPFLLEESAPDPDPSACEFVHQTLNGAAAVGLGGDLRSIATLRNADGVSGLTWRWERLGAPEPVATGSGAEAEARLRDVTAEDAGTYQVSFSRNGSPYAACNLEVRVPRWTAGRIGAGGFVTGGDVADDGTKVFRTDTSGGYLFDDQTGHFTQLIPARLGTRYNVPWNGTGVYEMLVAASDSRVMYAAYDTSPVAGGVIFRSRDGGKSWQAVKEGLQVDSNGGKVRTFQRHGDIDPRNPNHVLMGDETGMFRSTNGTRFDRVSGLPAPVGDNPPAYTGVAFNRASPVVGGRTSEIIMSSGDRYWRSTDSGESWQDISAGAPPFQPKMAEFDSRGGYYVAGKGLWRYENGRWKDLGSPSTQGTSFALDPDDPDLILVGRLSVTNFSISRDRGASWTPPNWKASALRSTGGIGWHTQEAGSGYLANSYIVDPVARRIWASGGNAGIASVGLDEAIANTPGEVVLDTHGVGIEQICPNRLVLPPGSNRVHAAFWDEGYGQLDRTNQSYPTVINDRHDFSASWGLDYSKQNPRFLARFFSWDENDYAASGWSSNDGTTWTPFASVPPILGGRGTTLAYSGIDNIILVPSNSGANADRAPWYTLDRGRTWKKVDLGKPWTAARTKGLHNAFYLNRQIVVADPDRLGTFYFYSNSDDESLRGIWLTEDGGASWTRTWRGLPPVGVKGTWNYNASLASPVSGHVWLTAGGEAPDGEPKNAAFFRSFDQGRTLRAVPGTREVIQFAFGAPVSEGGYPVLYIDGYVNGEHGTWASPDANSANPTWIRLGGFAASQPHQVRTMGADPDRVGRVWAGLGCAGSAYGDFSDLF